MVIAGGTLLVRVILLLTLLIHLDSDWLWDRLVFKNEQYRTEICSQRRSPSTVTKGACKSRNTANCCEALLSA